MSDDPVRTGVQAGNDTLAFQDYFVRLRCAPTVSGISFYGADKAEPTPSVLDAFADPALRAVIICPSNPYLSIDPILALPKIRATLEQCHAHRSSIAHHRRQGYQRTDGEDHGRTGN
jgi:LPPG:FO 2-phospho-L-lactate transferase